MISVRTLVAAGLAATQARLFAEPLAEACQRFGIDTPARIGAFVGQCRVESADFTKLEEDLYYRSPERIAQIFRSRVRTELDAVPLARNPKALANRVYAGKNGNGDEASGEGWLYRGRGGIQLTGRDNYHAAEVALWSPYLRRPELVAMPIDACLTAAWYFTRVRGIEMADAWHIDAITQAVNGRAMLHATLRRQYSEEAAGAFA